MKNGLEQTIRNDYGDVIADFHLLREKHRDEKHHIATFVGTIFVDGDWESMAEMYAIEEGLVDEGDDAGIDEFINKMRAWVRDSWWWDKGIEDALAERGNELLDAMVTEYIVEVRNDS